MSVQNQALKDPKLKDKNPAPGGILQVTVRGRLSDRPGMTPQTITLTNSVHTVRWKGVGLARGSRLEVHFPGDPRGPFVDLFASPVTPHEVTGYGNRGPQETETEYDYEVRIVRRGGLRRVVGTGRVINHATQRINDPRAGGLGEPPPGNPIG